MSTIYTQKQSSIQKKDASNATAVLDASSQSESLQRKADMANSAAQRAEAPRPNNTGMPDNLKAGIESLSGFSMDNVRVHYNSSKPATVQALAYTQGTDIHVAPGQEKCLPHEAWHVAQQMAGRVSPTTNINGMPVNDNADLEHEADVMGAKAVQCKKLEQIKESSNLNNVTQMMKVSADHIAGDLMHKHNKNIFEKNTIDWFNEEMFGDGTKKTKDPEKSKVKEFAKQYSHKIKYKERSKNRNKQIESLITDIEKVDEYDTLFTDETINLLKNNPRLYSFDKSGLTESVEKNRSSISYRKIESTKLKNGQTIRKWFYQDANEHMYVHVDDVIYTANRNFEKLPHPTLVGGDPDAKCAGTMRFNRSKKIITITNESGHFRPSNVHEDTKKIVKDITKNLGIKVQTETVK